MKKWLAKWSLLFSSVLCVNIVSAQTVLLSSSTTSPLTDGQVLLSSNSTKTAKDIYFPFSAKAGTEYDVIRGVLNLDSVTGGTISQANAIGAYAYCNVNSNAAAYPAKGNCAALSGFSIAATTGAAAWGIATNCQDNPGQVMYSATGNRTCFGAEFDVGIWDATGTTTANGVLVSLQGGGNLAGSLIAFNIINDTASLKWSFGLNCTNASIALACVNVGVSDASGTNVASQAIAWEYLNNMATGKAMTMKAPGAGGFVFATTDTSITTAMDWSKVPITNCVLKLVAGCVLSGAGAFIAAAATPVAPSGTIGYGSSIVAPGANNCPVFAGGKRVDGCSVINVAGSYKVMPYFEWVSP